MTSSGSITRLHESNSGKQGGYSHAVEIDEIVNYLNARTGSRFRSDAKITLALLEALFYKGYTLFAMKRVVDSKATEWGNSSKMKRYLKPSTLFDFYNFNRYLQEIQKADLLTTKSDQLC